MHEEKSLLTDTRESMIHSSDYHINVKHLIIYIEINSTRIKNHTLLILYKKIKTESNLARSSEIFVFKAQSRNIHILP